jgi:hypothetical protein
VDVEGIVYTMLPQIWGIKSFPDMARERERAKERSDAYEAAIKPL